MHLTIHKDAYTEFVNIIFAVHKSNGTLYSECPPKVVMGKNFMYIKYMYTRESFSISLFCLYINRIVLSICPDLRCLLLLLFCLILKFFMMVYVDIFYF